MASVSLPARVIDRRGDEPIEERPLELRSDAALPAYAVWASLLAVCGVAAIWPTVLLLWALWTTDPLKSIGGLIPLVSLWLILRVWRVLRWEARGSWWGLGLLAATIVAVHLRDRAVLELVLGPSWSITLPPHSVVAFAYASGAVLLFGGGQLWRAARFPVALMLLVNPVPHVLNRFVDLPLQHASAETARGLAHALGQRLTPDQLSLMFTPDFGMFIAPGCNGLRGAVAMGLMALIAGYLYRFRLGVWALVTAGGFLLGYAFNLLRLCVLVLYYVAALRWRWLQGHAEGADYCFGAALFFCAAVLLCAAVRRFALEAGPRSPALPRVAGTDGGSAEAHGRWYRGAAFLALVLGSAVPFARAWWPGRQGLIPVTQMPLRFPQAMGPYRLRRTWTESLATGQVLFEWADYGVPGAATTVSFGISPVLGAHDTLLCHVARGEDWLWRGSLVLPTPSAPVPFTAALFNDGATEYMEASTVCSQGGCGQWASERTHFGLVYSRMDPRTLWGTKLARPVPVLLRVETGDPTLPAPLARARLTEQLRAFSAYAPFDAFSYRYLRP